MGTTFIAIGIIGVMLFGLVQLMINIFGMDRGGFRAYMLMPVRRCDVLIGKNLALAPIASGIAIVLIIVLQCVMGSQSTHFLATLVQLVPSYLICCLIGNTASIAAPMAIGSGSLKPARPNTWAIFIQMFFMMLGPIALLPAIVALGAETALVQLGKVSGIPLYFVLSLVEAGIVIWAYRVIVRYQGIWLQSRETRILGILAEVPE